MLVQLNVKDLVLETSNFVTGISTYELNGETMSTVNVEKTLSFEGFSGFNEKYVAPLLEMFLKNLLHRIDTYKVMKIAGNLHNDDTIHEAEFYIIKNVRDTGFLFKTLKSFSISLPDLRLGYEISKDRVVLYLDRKIIKVLSTLEPEAQKDLTFYFYCLVRFIKAFNQVSPRMVYDLNNAVSINKEDLQALYIAYGNVKDTLIECIQLKEDVCFGDIYYVNYPFSELTKNNIDMKYTSNYVYNVIKIGTKENLCIINTTTKDYYIIDLSSSTIYTNSELKEYNTFDILEWIPNLVTTLHTIMPGVGYYRVKYLKLEQLLSSKEPEITITNDATNFEKLLEQYPYINENTNMKLYDGYFKNSKIKTDAGTVDLKTQYDNDAYAQELYKQVQPYYDTFDLKDLTGVVKGVSKGFIYSMLFEGESGTGKSTAARVIATRCGLPFVAINCSTNIEEADIFGTMIPNPNKESADDPEFIWQDGPLTKAIRFGYVGIIEELGFGRPGVLGKINSLLDEARQIDLPNGEVLKAHPNFRIIATTNIGYEGTNRLNKALVNRFEICKKFTELDEKETKAVIVSRTGYNDGTKIDSVMAVYKAIKKYSNEQNLGLVVSIRQLLNIFKQGKYYRTAKDAINNLLLNQAFLEEPEHLKYFVDNIFNAFDLSFKI